jgi:hypothetical protein
MGAGAPQADADAAENLDVLAAQMASGQVSAAASGKDAQNLDIHMATLFTNTVNVTRLFLEGFG